MEKDELTKFAETNNLYANNNTKVNNVQFNSFNDNIFIRQNTSKSNNDMIIHGNSESGFVSQIDNKKIFNSIESNETMDIHVNKNHFQINNANFLNKSENSNTNNSHKRSDCFSGDEND